MPLLIPLNPDFTTTNQSVEPSNDIYHSYHSYYHFHVTLLHKARPSRLSSRSKRSWTPCPRAWISCHARVWCGGPQRWEWEKVDYDDDLMGFNGDWIVILIAKLDGNIQLAPPCSWQWIMGTRWICVCVNDINTILLMNTSEWDCKINGCTIYIYMYIVYYIILLYIK